VTPIEGDDEESPTAPAACRVLSSNNAVARVARRCKNLLTSVNNFLSSSPHQHLTYLSLSHLCEAQLIG
jgi:hypothetical protein